MVSSLLLWKFSSLYHLTSLVFYGRFLISCHLESPKNKLKCQPNINIDDDYDTMKMILEEKERNDVCEE